MQILIILFLYYLMTLSQENIPDGETMEQKLNDSNKLYESVVEYGWKFIDNATPNPSAHELEDAARQISIDSKGSLNSIKSYLSAFLKMYSGKRVTFGITDDMLIYFMKAIYRRAGNEHLALALKSIESYNDVQLAKIRNRCAKVNDICFALTKDENLKIPTID